MIMVLGPHKKKAEAPQRARRGARASAATPPPRPTRDHCRPRSTTASDRRGLKTARDPVTATADPARQRAAPGPRRGERHACRRRRRTAARRSASAHRHRQGHARAGQPPPPLEDKLDAAPAGWRGDVVTSPAPTSRRSRRLLGKSDAVGTPDSTKESSRGTRQAGSQRPQEAPGRPRARQRLPRSALAAVPQGQGAGHPLAASTPTATARSARATSAGCGSSGSTPPPAPTA